MKKIPFVLCFILSTSVCAGNIDLLRTTADIQRLPQMYSISDIPFELTGTVVNQTSADRIGFVLKDETGATEIFDKTSSVLRQGDVIRASGYIEYDKKGKQWLNATRVTVLRHGKRPPVVQTTIPAILDGRNDYQVVRVEGSVIGEFTDDIDSDFRFLLLSEGGHSLPVALHESEFKHKEHFLNARITVTGICLPNLGDVRAFHGHGLTARLSDVRIDVPAPADPFAVPDMDNLHCVDPENILRLSQRRLNGTVIATWHEDRLMLVTDGSQKSIVTLAHPADLPAVGQRICIVGLPDTDLFNINFSSARWKPLDSPTNAFSVEYATLNEIHHPSYPNQRLLPNLHGKLLRLAAEVRSVPRSDFNNARMHVEQDGHVFPVDVSSCPAAVTDVDIGCRIELEGVCVLETESWRMNAPLPRIKGMTIVLRSPSDLRIVSRPPWWTPARLFTVMGVLMAVLCGILFWNVSLRRLAERRGKALAASAIAQAESDLKVYERTRLAVELHDSVAQNLTGVSLAIRGQNYELAAKTLDSCREDLRNCMWDLRNLTLDDEDINAAIRKTLAPHVGTAALTIRFNVPRDRFTDNTAHTILRILRELAVNAVRHGGATTIRIAGSIENDKLLFSVRDNGRGFEPAKAPGMEDGHFGLQGIRDRIESFEGDVTIDSAPGRGTRVTIALNVPREKKEDRT